MEDNNGATGSTPQENGQHASPAQGQPDVQGQSVTLEQVRDLIQGAINPIAAQIRRMATRPEDQPKAARNDAAEQTLAERLRAIEERESRQSERSRVNGMKQAALSAGIPANRVDVLTAYLLQRDGSRIRLADDGESVQYVDEFEQVQDASEYLRRFLSSADGEMFRPAVQVPAGRGLRGGSVPGVRRVPYHAMGDDERRKLTPAEAMALIREEMAGNV